MGRAVDVAKVVVGAAVVVLVANDDCDRRAGRVALEDSGQNLGLVGFVALGDESRLAGTATIQVELDLAQVDR